MRAQAVLRRTRSSIARTVHTSCVRPILLSSVRSPRHYDALRPTRTSLGHTPPFRRPYSTASDDPNPPIEVHSEETVPSSSEAAEDAALPEPPPEEADKPRRGRKVVSKEVKEMEPPSLPSSLNILWSPEPDVSPEEPPLIPSELFEDALSNLQVTLYGPTQLRSVYPSKSGSLVEPTLALYCPIEGGQYIVDQTVQELARATNADVVVIDAVELAAGEWGVFGKPAGVLQLPNNPLQTSSSPPPEAQPEVQSEEEDGDERGMFPHAMTVHLMSSSDSPTRVRVALPQDSSSHKVKAFFDAVVNLPVGGDETPESARSKPRLIYVKDVHTLSSSSAAWYPHLLAAVRQRRKGPLSKPPIVHPMTIVLGFNASISGSRNPSVGSSSGRSELPMSLIRMISNRDGPTPIVPGASRSGRFPWSEDPEGDRAREQRLRARLRVWERGVDAVRAQLPPLTTSKNASSSSGSSRRGNGLPDVLVIEDSFGNVMHRARRPGASSESQSDSESDSPYFKISVLVPSVRSLGAERACRISRRRRINELMMRMAIGSVGGNLSELGPLPSDPIHLPAPPTTVESTETASEQSAEASESEASAAISPSPPSPRSPERHENAFHAMWEHWGRDILPWDVVRRIADLATGRTLSSHDRNAIRVDDVAQTWPSIAEAWAARRRSYTFRKNWIKSSMTARESDEEKVEHNTEKHEEKIARIKADPELDPHEHRLLGCIVDTGSMPTSFNEVHLPTHTIDSVRTMVSLPLLYPSVFQQGILKQHAMTGCLLFGPPGTGKTLLVKALAKEADCQMLSIAPSDVMDMYVGEGEKLVRSVFSLARRISPCVVFLDEIDALFGARASARETAGGMAHRGILTEFMQEMDGLKSSKADNVIVIGATNRPFDLDDAVLRRLPRRLLVDIPGPKEREAILRILLRDEVLDEDVALPTLAKQTESFSGSDLKHLCVSAALDAVKEQVKVPWAVSSTTESQTMENTSLSVVLSPSGSDTPPGDAISSESSSTPLTPIPVDLESASIDQSPQSESSSILEEGPSEAESPPVKYQRILRARNFAKALREITPSSSEALGTLSALRRWNDEFGEGGREKRRKQVWGRDRFGFIQSPAEAGLGEGKEEEGKVA